MKAIMIVIGILLMGSIGMVSAVDFGWTSFNDLSQNDSGLGSDPDYVTNYSFQTTPLVYSNNGSLIDFGTGTYLDANFTMISPTWNTVAYPNCWDCLGSNSNPETDMYNLLYDRMNATGIFAYQNGNHNYLWAGLNSSRKYRVSAFANRAGGGGYEGRLGTFQIQDVLSFTPNPSMGVTNIGTTFVTNDSQTFGVGDNTAEGYIASWTDISPGADGDIFVNVSKNPLFSSVNPYMNALMIEQLPEIPSDAFTIVVIPDIQSPFQDGLPHLYHRELQWVVDHQESMNVQFVTSVGDIIENQGTIAEWTNASLAWGRLETAGIPFSVLPGNHEYLGYGHQHTYGVRDNAVSPNYDKYFNVSRFNETSWWGGNYKNLTNSYYLQTIEDTDFIFISMGWCPTQDEIDWADGILTTYNNRNAIFSTHGYLDETTNSTQGGSTPGSGVNNCDIYSNASNSNYGNTTYIWNMLKTHPNVQLILNGHEHETSPDDGQRLRVDTNDFGNPVYSILTSYQDWGGANGNGIIRLLTFVPSENKIYATTYDTDNLSEITGSLQKFELDYIFERNISEDLSSKYKFSENLGTTAYDTSGNSNDGTIIGASWDNDGILNTLTAVTDYTISTTTGLFTITNNNYLYNWVNTSWSYIVNEPDCDAQTISILELAVLFLALAVMLFSIGYGIYDKTIKGLIIAFIGIVVGGVLVPVTMGIINTGCFIT